MSTTSATSGRVPSVFDYGSYAFLTGVEPVTELCFVRHGQQAILGGQGPFGDAIDPPLSETGRRQAELVGRRFANERVDAVYSSTLVRAHATGSEIARWHGLEPVRMADLREVEVFRDVPPEMSVEQYLGTPLFLGVRERMIVEKRWDVYPYSEASGEFRKRTVNAIEGIVATNEAKRVVIACHGGVINAYLAHHLGIDHDMFFRPAHTAVNVVRAGHNGVRALHSLGDVHHLLGEGDDLLTY
jgi:2,3-bisphosphoglycerate-dependent phosphoglycerate mutase